ncbi:MAG: alpha/beta hydrolase [Nocardioides sp.]|nr:alpha/beta hydrolase [Nocardioides sp.]
MSVRRLTTYERDGLVFDVTDDGPFDGDPVVLLHGFPEKGSCWAQVTERLHAAGLRTYAPDQRGYSPGARPRRRRDYRVDVLIEDVVALIDRIGRPVHLVGHDWGSVVGWGVAAKRPDLVRTWTAVSVPHPIAFARSWFTSRQGLKSWYMLLFNVPGLVETVGRRAPGRLRGAMRKAGMDHADVQRFQHEILDDDALLGGLMWYRGLPLVDSSAKRPRVSVPTTLVWSDEDVAIARASVDTTPRYVDAPYELVELRGVSHWIPSQAPDALAEAVLARVASVADGAA